MSVTTNLFAVTGPYNGSGEKRVTLPQAYAVRVGIQTGCAVTSVSASMWGTAEMAESNGTRVRSASLG
jgi:hypothetical protein